MKARVANQRSELRNLKRKSSVGKGKARRGSRYDDTDSDDSDPVRDHSFGVAYSATASSAGDSE